MSEQEIGGFYAVVKDRKGQKVIDRHVPGMYLPDAVKNVIKVLPYMIPIHFHGPHYLSSPLTFIKYEE